MHAFVLDRKRECTSRRNGKEKQSHLKEWHCRRPTLMNVRSCLKSPFFRERRSSIANADDPSRCRDVFPSNQTSDYRRSKRTYACSQQTRNLICLWCNTHVTQEIKFRSIRLCFFVSTVSVLFVQEITSITQRKRKTRGLPTVVFSSSPCCIFSEHPRQDHA